MSPLDLLGRDIRDRAVVELLELRGVNSIEIEVIEDRAFLAIDQQGISIVANSSYQIDTLHFYGEGVQGCSMYYGELPFALHFGETKCEVISQLGPPSAYGGGRVNPNGEVIPKWIRFDFPLYSVHLQFSPNDHLELVTAMASSTVPK